MKYPSAEEVRTHESSFEAAHSEARKKEFNGSLVLDGGSGEGVVVYLEGWPIYAEYHGLENALGTDALDLMTEQSGKIERNVSRKESVEMFRTYMEYIGENQGSINIYEADRVEVSKRTILVTKAGSLEKTTAPAGTRVGYAPDLDYVEEYFAKNEATGYALSNDEIVFYEEGDETDREGFKQDGLSMLVSMESDEGLAALECAYLDVYTQGASGGKGEVDVEFDIEGWEIVEGEVEDSGGMLGGLLG